MVIDNGLVEVTNMKRTKEYDMNNMENVFRHVKGETMDMSDLKEKKTDRAKEVIKNKDDMTGMFKYVKRK